MFKSTTALNRLDSISGLPQVQRSALRIRTAATTRRRRPSSAWSRARCSARRWWRRPCSTSNSCRNSRRIAPQFFLIPGDKQVTVLWKPSATETTGDPFFQIVGSPTKLDASGATVAEPALRPELSQVRRRGLPHLSRPQRQRRARSSSWSSSTTPAPSSRTSPASSCNGNCAPELGILTDCPVNFPTAGQSGCRRGSPAFTVTARSTTSVRRRDGSPLIFADLGVADAARGPCRRHDVAARWSPTRRSPGAQEGSFPPLADTGVPFIFVDKAGAADCVGCGVNNGINYFYSVTAFDVNAPGHGPTSLESAKVTHQVTPRCAGGQLHQHGQPAASRHLRPRRSCSPTTSCRRSTRPRANSASRSRRRTRFTVRSAGFPTQLLSGAGAGWSSSMTRPSITSFSADRANIGIRRLVHGSRRAPSVVPLSVSATVRHGDVRNGAFTALAVDSALSAQFGGGAGFTVGGTFQSPGSRATSPAIWGRVASTAAFPAPVRQNRAVCFLNGPRWFIGANETKANPNASSPNSFNSGHPGD